MIFLVDHNIKGQALALYGSIATLGWLAILPIQFVTFEAVGLSIESNDRVVWRFAQANHFILLTANRSMKGEDSLEQTLREENTPSSLPVITIGDTDRIMKDLSYRDRCVNRLVEIMLEIDNYRGTRRIFIP